ncbi:MAG: GtrA family protein [Deltaproteobacteria bacterium]|nr:GtrA family protein [Deltaproteobacteria bacterium]
MGAGDLARRFPWARFLKFCIVGGSGVFVNYGVYLPLTRWLHVLEESSQALSIAVSILTNFVLNEVWTFRDRRSGGAGGFFRRLSQFYLVSLVGAAIQWGVAMPLCYRTLGVPDMLAVLIGIGVATGWNFLLNLIWTWKKSSAATPKPPTA